jgi:hypothetical protein
MNSIHLNQQPKHHLQKKPKIMKLHKSLMTLLCSGVAFTAMAQTDITLTGATAFRQATLQAVYNAYVASNQPFQVVYNGPGNSVSEMRAANQVIFQGTFPGITGTTIVRTSFNGSTEGLNAIAGNNNPAFLTAAALGSAPAPGLNYVPQGGVNSPTEQLRPRFSFSDVFQSTSPVDNEVLQPVGASAVGVVAFAMVASNGAPGNWTNATIQQCRALWQAGIQPLSLFTGNPADTTLVFATGRNDGSGTRSAYLTEWTYGVANPVRQYVATTAGVTTPGVLTAITLVPENGTGPGNLATQGGGTGAPNDRPNASSLWGINITGNGGYASSSSLRALMSRTATSVTVYDGVNQAPLLSNQSVLLLTWLSTADSQNAAAAGAKILGFNGVEVTPLAASDPNNFQGSGFNQTDLAKLTSGAYSAWSYQHLYHHGTLSANELAWRNAMVQTFIEPGLQQTANGVTLSAMDVERADDGFPIFADF